MPELRVKAKAKMELLTVPCEHCGHLPSAEQFEKVAKLDFIAYPRNTVKMDIWCSVCRRSVSLGGNGRSVYITRADGTRGGYWPLAALELDEGLYDA